MNDREKWRERVRDIRATSTTWWYIYIIIIISCHLHGYHWPSLATFPYRSSPLTGLQGYIPYPHIGAVLAGRPALLGHMWGSIGVIRISLNIRHLQSTYFPVDPFILLYWFYSIRRELIDIFSIIVYFKSTSCPTLGHHQGRMQLLYVHYYFVRRRASGPLLYLGNKQLWKIYQSIPAEYNKINTAIWKDQQENI